MTKKQEEKTISQEEFERLQSEFEELKTLSTQLETQLKRAVADYHNLERRVNEGRGEINSWANSELVRNLLPVMDHLFHAVEGAELAGEQSGWLQGVRMAAQEFKKVMEQAGLEIIAPMEGDIFDPRLHEAIDIAEGEDERIVKLAEMGYKINDQVLKPAKVVVGRKGE